MRHGVSLGIASDLRGSGEAVKVPHPKVMITTWSKLMRLKRRFEVQMCNGDDEFECVPMARFTTLPEAEAYAERLKAVVKSVGVERRDDGQVVPSERWENGLRSIVTVIGWVSKSFEIREVVDRVERIYKLAIKAGVKECAICGELELYDPSDERTHLGHNGDGRLCHQRCAMKERTSESNSEVKETRR